jgi:hypothetical protein
MHLQDELRSKTTLKPENNLEYKLPVIDRLYPTEMASAFRKPGSNIWILFFNLGACKK